MSMSEVKRFADKLNADWTLRGYAEEYETRAAGDETPLARAVAFAEQNGYNFTLDEAKVYTKEMGDRLGFSISDSELDRVSGFRYAGGILGMITGDF